MAERLILLSMMAIPIMMIMIVIDDQGISGIDGDGDGGGCGGGNGDANNDSIW